MRHHGLALLGVLQMRHPEFKSPHRQLSNYQKHSLVIASLSFKVIVYWMKISLSFFFQMLELCPSLFKQVLNRVYINILRHHELALLNVLQMRNPKFKSPHRQLLNYQKISLWSLPHLALRWLSIEWKSPFSYHLCGKCGIVQGKKWRWDEG